MEKIKLKHEREHFPVFDAAGHCMHIVPDGCIAFCQGIHVPCYSECVFLLCDYILNRIGVQYNLIDDVIR